LRVVKSEDTNPIDEKKKKKKDSTRAGQSALGWVEARESLIDKSGAKEKGRKNHNGDCDSLTYLSLNKGSKAAKTSNAVKPGPQVKGEARRRRPGKLKRKELGGARKARSQSAKSSLKS